MNELPGVKAGETYQPEDKVGNVPSLFLFLEKCDPFAERDTERGMCVFVHACARMLLCVCMCVHTRMLTTPEPREVLTTS